MSKIKFRRVNPFIEAGSGEAYHFTYDGEPYFVEVWSAGPGSGEDIYREADGRQVIPFTSDEDEAEFETALERAKEAFNEAWGEHISPHMDAMQQAFVELANKEV